MHRSTPLLVILFACLVSTTWAQAIVPPRGTRSLFGGARTPVPRAQSLDTLVSVSGAVDDGGGGEYSDIDASLSFVRARPRFSVSTRVDSGLRLLSTNALTSSNHSGGATLSGSLSRKTSVRVHLDGNHVPGVALDTLSRRSALDSGSPTPAELDHASVDWATTSYGATTELSRTLGRRSSVGLSYGARFSEKAITRRRSLDHTFSGHVGRQVGRDSRISWSYTFRQGDQGLVLSGPTKRFDSHDTQFGVERQWHHESNRRTVVNLSGGPAVLDYQSALPERARTRPIRMVGAVTLAHEHPNRWTVRGSYRRGPGPRDTGAFSDTGAVDVQAWLGPRLDLTISSGYSADDEGTATTRDRTKTSFGSAKLQVGLSRLIALYGQYFLYQYDLGSFVQPTTASPSQFDRHGARVGLTAWVPLR